MNKNTLRTLAARKAIVYMPHGKWGVKVLLQYRQAALVNTFREMSRLLREKFANLAKENPTLMIDVDGISLARQCTRGVLPVEQFEQMIKLLETEQIEVRIFAKGIPWCSQSNL